MLEINDLLGTRVFVELETLTPLVNRGVDGTNLGPEGVRASTVRGQLRWWFRVLVGAHVSLEEMRALESLAFGSASRRGVVSTEVRLLPGAGGTPAAPKRWEYHDWYEGMKEPKKLDQARERVKYLFYPMRGPGMKPSRENRGGSEYEYWEPGLRFELAFRFCNKAFEANRGKLGENCALLKRLEFDDCEKLVGCAAWCLVFLGGVGARTRRGAGSLAVTRREGLEFPFAPEGEGKGENAPSASEGEGKGENAIRAFCEYLKGTLERVWRYLHGLLDGNAPRGRGLRGEFSQLANGSFDLWLLPPKESGMEALDALGKFYVNELHGQRPKKYRWSGGFRHSDGVRDPDFFHSNLRKDKKTGKWIPFIRDYPPNGAPVKERRPLLGLPIDFSRKFSVEVLSRKKEVHRRASPLHFTVAKWDSKYWPLVLFFRSKIIPNEWSLNILRQLKQASSTTTITKRYLRPNGYPREVSEVEKRLEDYLKGAVRVF
ncbi:MAG: hypothetical protein Kow0069_37690 [Promethearchaeota archaeon]